MAFDIFINSETGAVRSAAAGGILPILTGKLFTEIIVHVRFVNASGTVVELAAGTTGILALKPEAGYTGDRLISDSLWTKVGTGEDTYYEFSSVLDSAALRTLLANQDRVSLLAEVEWLIPDATAPKKSLNLRASISNAVIRDTDDPPDPATDAAWTWLKSRIVAGNGITLTIDDDAKTITASAGYAQTNGLFIEFCDSDGVLIGKSPRAA